MDRTIGRLCTAIYFSIICGLTFSTGLYAQRVQLITVDSLFAMAERNSKQLDMSRQMIGISHENTAIAKERQLPDLEGGASVGYISNAHVWNQHFDYQSTVKMPHISNDFSVAAGLVVFNGGAIKNNIAKSKLEEQVASLDFQKNKEDILFLLLAKYLDLFTLYNQQKVFRQNIDLANRRLLNIQRLATEGMVTHNDIIRSRLQLTDLNLQLTEINNNVSITNHDLGSVIGLPDSTEIEVDSTLLNRMLTRTGIAAPDNSLSQLPEIQSAESKMQIASKDIEITKAEKLPVVSLFASDALSRPFLYSIPPLDIYMHYFQGGVRLKYDIGSLYKAKSHIEKARLSYHLAETQKDWLLQKSEMEMNSAYIKLNEARDKFHSLEESYALAQDNYRIVEQKYMNQLAVMTDVLDASTSLLSSQLNLSNARVSIIYQWFNLMKASGNWEHK